MRLCGGQDPLSLSLLAALVTAQRSLCHYGTAHTRPLGVDDAFMQLQRNAVSPYVPGGASRERGMPTGHISTAFPVSKC